MRRRRQGRAEDFPIGTIEEIRDQMAQKDWTPVENSVWNQARDRVWESLRGQVWDRVPDEVKYGSLNNPEFDSQDEAAMVLNSYREVLSERRREAEFCMELMRRAVKAAALTSMSKEAIIKASGLARQTVYDILAE